MATNISRLTINATPQKVWDILTVPSNVKQWQYGSDLHTDWTAGTTIRFSTEWNGQTFEQWGIVLEYQPFKKLRYNLFAPRPGLEDIPENYFEMIYELEAVDDKTYLCITQEDNRPHAVQEPEQGEESVVLQKMKQLAEL